MNTEAMFSSKSDNWETPKEFFENLNQIYHFELDPCADEKNYKCEKYYTIEQNGLRQDWSSYRVFINPPYGRTIGKWIQKAYETNKEHGNLIVMLLPSRTDTKWFHDWIYGKAEIQFIKGRLKFGTSKTSAPFPSMLVIFPERKKLVKLEDKYKAEEPKMIGYLKKVGEKSC